MSLTLVLRFVSRILTTFSTLPHAFNPWSVLHHHPRIGCQVWHFELLPIAYIPFARARCSKHLQSCAVFFFRGKAFCFLDISDLFRFWMQVLLGIFLSKSRFRMVGVGFFFFLT
jgi:hypothetical protein